MYFFIHILQFVDKMTPKNDTHELHHPVPSFISRKKSSIHAKTKTPAQ